MPTEKRVCAIARNSDLNDEDAARCVANNTSHCIHCTDMDLHECMFYYEI